MVSVVIPAYNEEQALPHTLRELFYQSGDYEVIIVDGGSTDRTRTVAESFGFIDSEHDLRRLQDASRETLHASRLLLTAPKGRAAQMNAGAQQARGDWLLFLHADTVLPSGAIQRLNGMETSQEIRAGGFMHQFSIGDWRLKLISFLDNFRCIRSRIIYGDQALFVRRALFEQLGGFPNQPILEDVAFCERLIRVTAPLLLSPPVMTDARKFLKMGVWRSFLRVLLIILHVEFHLPTLPRAFFRDVR
ncbi:MAG: glycosyltransferase [Nitrospira sp. CG24E]|nr:MAG: glycosyltransferase [Nitrospira sp. CG24E]